MRQFAILTALTVALVSGRISQAQLVDGRTISINFSGGAGSEDPQPDIDTVDAGEITGVVPRGGWNNGSLDDGMITALKDDSGIATPATITWASDTTWGRNLAPSPTNDLLSDYLDGARTFPVSIGMTNIPFTLYDVYVYTRRNENSDNSVQTDGSNNLLSDYTLNGTLVQNVRTGDIRDTFVLATGTEIGNYIKFEDVVGATLSLRASDNLGNFRSPVDGIQIVEQIPEPGSISAVALGALSLLGVRRFRRR